MTKTVEAHKLRTNLGEYLNEVYYKDSEVIVKRHGKPIAKITQIKSPVIDNKNDPIWQLPEHAVKTGQKDLASNIDKILYDKSK
jgi:prevent-host-death family protein